MIQRRQKNPGPAACDRLASDPLPFSSETTIHTATAERALADPAIRRALGEEYGVAEQVEEIYNAWAHSESCVASDAALEEMRKFIARAERCEEAAVATAGFALCGRLSEMREMASLFPKTVVLRYSDRHGKQPIHYASEAGHADVVAYLLSEGVSATARTRDGYHVQPIHLASMFNHAGVLQVLFSRPIDPRIKAGNDTEPLHCAIRTGSLEAMLELLSHPGVSPNDTMRLNQLPCNQCMEGRAIHLACAANKPRLVASLLLRDDVDPNDTTTDGFCAIHVACAHESKDVACLLMEEHGVDPDCRSKNGTTPLFVACQYGSLEMARLLVERSGASVHLANDDGWTPLHAACLNGSPEVLAFLLRQRGISLTARTRSGFEPLHLACKQGDVETARTLATHCPAVIVSRNARGQSALEICCAFEQTELIRTLLPLVPVADWARALRYACYWCPVDVVALLLHQPGFCCRESEVPVLHYACKHDNVDVARFLLSRESISPATPNPQGVPPIHIACESGSLGACRLLLEHRADPNLRTPDGWHAIHYACKHGHLDVVRLLLSQQGVDDAVFGQDCPKYCPLTMAARHERHELVRWLLSYRAVSARAIDRTLAFACKAGRAEIVRCIVDSGYSEGRVVGATLPEKLMYDACNSGRGLDTALALVPPSHDIVDYCSTAWEDPENATVVWQRFLEQLDRRDADGARSKWGQSTRRVLTRMLHAVGEGKVPPHEMQAALAVFRRRECHQWPRGEMLDFDLLRQTCVLGHLDLLRHVMRAEVDRIVDKDSRSLRDCLSQACEHGHVAVVEYLVSSVGVTPTWASRSGVADRCSRRMSDVVRSSVCDPPIVTACVAGQLDVAKYLFSLPDICPGAPLPGTLHLQYPLHVACIGRNLALVRFILAQEDVSVTCLDAERFQPLHIACLFGEVDMVRWLLRHARAPPLERTIHGHQPLHLAISQGHRDTAQVLLEFQRERRAMRAEFRWWAARAHAAIKSRQNRAEGLKVQRLRPLWRRITEASADLAGRRRRRALRTLAGSSGPVRLWASLHAKKRKKVEGSKCCICLHRDPNMAPISCGHLHFCDVCASLPGMSESCPICRIPVTEWLRIYR